MSSITIIKLRLKGVNADLLKQVVEQLCKEHNGQMTNTIEDYFHKTERVELGFKCREMPRGAAFSIKQGEVEVKGDFYETGAFERTIQRELTQQYTAQAHIASFHQMGFQTQTSKVGEKIVIRAFAW
ncbi:hypothetical protein MUP77_01300 [Candidatus Bathyarchaeota archaeon]|nr:hypothetical protein [Candidatus Bathyarchaeota archaeon]